MSKGAEQAVHPWVLLLVDPTVLSLARPLLTMGIGFLHPLSLLCYLRLVLVCVYLHSDCETPDLNVHQCIIRRQPIGKCPMKNIVELINE